jgi:hypothetical protein
MVSRPLILSASRRTDLPGWHAEVLAARLLERLSRRRRPEGLVVWTRFPGALVTAPLRPLLEGAYANAVVNLTLTGLGGTALEPRAPVTPAALAALPDLISVLGAEPDRLRWRFDPLVPGQGLQDRFTRIAEVMARLGVPTATVSFPAERSLRGDLRSQYRRHGVPVWRDRGEQAEALAGLLEAAAPRGIRLLVCCQPEVAALDPRLGVARCIPPDLLARRSPALAHWAEVRDPSQRQQCQCAPSEDLGDYRADVCHTGCRYCYSTLGGPDPGECLPWFLRRKGKDPEHRS